jgi:D-alanyl-D-alanine dipeptidase
MQPTLPCENVPGTPEFRALSDIDGLAVELRYATPNNFVGRDLYSPLDCAWLHRDAVAALERSLARLKSGRPDCTLLILDALRPQRVQEQLWASLLGTNLLEYLAEPSRGSIHSFGMAVDVTIVDAAGRELDMGTGFDDMTERSHPVLEESLVARGALHPEQVAHRQLLRDAMSAGGWRGINSEWWHFDCGDRVRIRSEFRRVL